MKRRLLFFVFAMLLFGATARATEPTGCSAPNDFQAVSPNFRIMDQCGGVSNCLPMNPVLCAINALEDGLDAVGSEVRSGCVATSLTPGERKLIGVPLSGSPLGGTEPVFVSVKDTTVPSRLEEDGIQELTSNQAKVWIFNHDPSLSRSGTVCALVVE